jgi:hypothetical protein
MVRSGVNSAIKSARREIVNLVLHRFPPGVEMPESPDVAPRMAEYREVFERMKKEHLRGRKYWYLNNLGRHPQRHEPGMFNIECRECRLFD